MDFLLRSLFLLLATSALAQYEGYGGHGYDGHGGHGAHDFGGFRGHSEHHQSLDGHGEEFDLDYHAHPKYSFDYSVKDPHTGDDKDHWETRDGDKVKGTYTLIETDGTKRVVEYEADDKNGFNAVVHKIGTPKHEEPYHKEPYKQEYKEDYHVKEPVYHAKPAREPVAYSQEYGYDDGFVPSFGH